MTENTENFDLIQAAQEAVEPHQLTDGIWLVRDAGGDYQHLDLTEQIEAAQPRPNRKHGHRTVTDVDSFAGYVAKHGIDATEVYGNRDQGQITAIINADDGDTATDGPVASFDKDGQTGEPGWGDHTVALQLQHSDDWREWNAADGKWLHQGDFAEFVEDHLPNFGQPSGADMLELARSFKATQRVEFGHSQHAGGKTTVAYTNTTDAKAGQKGNVEFPDRVTLGVYVYDQGKAYELGARIRYRVADGTLLLGFKLERPKDVLQAAFNDVVAAVETATKRDVWSTR